MQQYTIGFVLDDSLDRPDGVQQYVRTIGDWLQQRGHDVHCLVSTSNRHDPEHVHVLSRNMSVRFNGNRMRMPLPASGGAIRHLLKTVHFDVLHVQMPYSPLLAGRVIARAAPQTAVVGTFHIVPVSPLVHVAGRLLAKWCRPTLRRFDTILSVSSAAQDFALSGFGLKSIVVPNAVDISRFRHATPILPLQPPAKRIVFLGRLVPRKGCMALLEAVRLLQSDPTAPPFAVTICGDGALRPVLEGFVKKHHLEDRVTFTGFISETDKPGYYASADITVFPSMGGESFGIVLLEAMASGVSAVLAGDNPGYRSVLGADATALSMFDPTNPAVLAERIRVLLQDEEQRQDLIRQQQQRLAVFDVHVVGQQLLDIYEAALRRRQSVQ